MKGAGYCNNFLDNKKIPGSTTAAKSNLRLTLLQPGLPAEKVVISLLNKLFFFLAVIHFVILFGSCTVTRQISRQANNDLLKDSAIATGHIGISIYEPATGKYWYNFNAEKYFVPASNVKLFTLYAGMKYLGDSLVGLRYEKISDSKMLALEISYD